MADVSTLGAWAQELLELCEGALVATPGGPIGRSFVAPGEPALDCCPQLTVHVAGLQIENTSPSSPVTAPAHRLTTTGAMFLATLVVTVARCVPISEDGAQAIVLPSPASLNAAGLEVDADLWALWNAVATAQQAGTIFEGRCAAFYMDPPIPLQTEGGCGGWVMTFRAAIPGYQAAG